MSKLNLTVSRGSAILYRGDSLPTAMSLISASLTFDRQTYDVIRRSISARALEFGQLQPVVAASPTPIDCGPQASLASLSPRQVKAMGLLTSGTYGPNSSISSSSADLKSFLANRLRQRTDSLGSTLFNLTWKERATPSGRSIPALRASVRRTSANECTGWPTPTTKANAGGEYADPEKAIARALGPHSNDIRDFVRMASWNTPSARDHKDTPGMATTGTNPDGTTRERIDMLPRQAMHLTSWPTPTVADINRSRSNNAKEYSLNLMKRDQPGSNLATTTQAFCADGPARLTASGHLVTGYSAETVSGDQLNPEHSRWLMASPAAWAQAAPSWQDWQAWQGLMQSLSPEQKSIALGRSAPTATPSILSKPPSSAGLLAPPPY